MSIVGFTVNGAHHDLELDTRTTLLDALREHLQLSSHALLAKIVAKIGTELDKAQAPAA